MRSYAILKGKWWLLSSKNEDEAGRVSTSKLTLKTNNQQDCQQTAFSAKLSAVAGGSLAETGSAGLFQLSLR